MNQGQVQGLQAQAQAQAGQDKATSSACRVLRQGRWFRHTRAGIRLQRFPPRSRGMRRIGTGTPSGQCSPRRRRRQGDYSGKGTQQTRWHRRCMRPPLPPLMGCGPSLSRQRQGQAPLSWLARCRSVVVLCRQGLQGPVRAPSGPGRPWWTWRTCGLGEWGRGATGGPRQQRECHYQPNIWPLRSGRRYNWCVHSRARCSSTQFATAMGLLMTVTRCCSG